MNKLLLIVNTCLFLSSTIYVHASPINLTEKDMYVRQGFDKKWITSLPDENDKNWQKFPAKKDNRPVRVRDLKFKDIPKFKHFSLKQYPDMIFTYVTSFELSKEKILSDPLGLFLSRIGLNWEVYVNGVLIKSEMHLDKKGSIIIERAIRSELIELNHQYLKPGRNILAFKIVGNPVDDRTGLYMKTNYKIDKLSVIKKSNEYVIELMLIGVYMFFGLYHIFLFVIRRKEKFNFVYGAFAMVISTYWFTRTEIIFSLFDNTATMKIIEMVSLSLTPAAFFPLLDLLVRNRIVILTRILTVISILVSIIIIFIWRESLLRVTQVLILLGLIYSTIYCIFYPFIKEIIEDFRRLKKIKNYRTIYLISTAFLRSLIFTIPGNLLIGIIVLLTTSFIDIINLNKGISSNLAPFGFTFFVLGIAGILANRFVWVHNQVEELNVSLEEKVKERTSQLQDAQGLLLKAAHQAGMAEIAADALHNIGNFLSGVVYCTDEIKQIITESNAQDLLEANAMLESHREDIGKYITEDPKGSLLPDFYIEFGRSFIDENRELDSKADQLLENAQLIMDILKNQREYIKGNFFVEEVNIITIIEEVLMLHGKELEKFNIIVERKYNRTKKIIINTQRGKLILSLSNIIKNAIEALEKNTSNRILTVDINTKNDKLYIIISDNGEGIAEENLGRILHQGFTTKENGLGIGLHFCANFMQETGGDISVESEGKGRGATITLGFKA